jgi:hypothetical protein
MVLIAVSFLACSLQPAPRPAPTLAAPSSPSPSPSPAPRPAPREAPVETDEYTRYELLAPETASFHILYEVTATAPGAPLLQPDP